MKTITSENKVNFYAPYWHLEVAYGGDNTGADSIGYMLLDLKESGYNEEDFKYWKVYLKPLSSISDEDAIQICRIIGINETMSRFTTPSAIRIGKRMIEDLFTLTPKDVTEPFRVISIYQYLQSKGYALPYINYSVDDLVELGVIKLKK